MGKAKTFRVEDLSGRSYGVKWMTQDKLFRFIHADKHDRESISNLDIGDFYREIKSLSIRRVK